jgi:hypothetical protein
VITIGNFSRQTTHHWFETCTIGMVAGHTRIAAFITHIVVHNLRIPIPPYMIAAQLPNAQ